MIELNQSTNHLPLHDDVQRAMLEGVSLDIGHYGEATGSRELKMAIANHYSVDMNKYDILLTNGSLEAIHMILDTFSSYYRNFVDIIPSWPWPRSLAKWRGYRMAPSTGKITQKDIVENSIVFLNNAQNPMGYVYTNEELYNLQDVAESKNSMIINDIAYWDLFDEPYPLLLNDKNFVTFTFSKAAGLAGLRIGGLIASKDNVERFRHNNPARLGVSVLAESVAMASLNSIDEWKPRNQEIIKNNKQRVREEFSDLKGVNFLHKDSIHKLIVTFDDNIDVTEFTNRLKKEGIFIADISMNMYEYGQKQPNVHIIAFTIAISDEWLNELINKFKKVYYSYER